MRHHKERCSWCLKDDLYQNYHDQEWGVPVYDDQVLFEFLVLESMQAGLNWHTILKKRENFRQAFDQFNPEKVARYTDKKVAKLMQDAGIIRHDKKILAAIQNAKAFLKIQEQVGSFSDWIWKFVDYQPIQNPWQSLAEVPTTTKISDQLAKELKKLGFQFLGSTTCYAHMQATGMVNDHLISCFRYKECGIK